MSLIEVKLRPTGPWRVGDRTGDRERVDVVYHSDALFSAITHAMRAFGWLEEWLDATARASGMPAVRFSSLFPFVGKTRLVSPPKSAWPPAQPGKLYLQGAKLVPLEVVKNGVVEEARWQVDGESECLVPLGGIAPFRVSIRAAAGVDRLSGTAEPHRTACLEFSPNAGWWGVFEVSDAVWETRVKSAFKLLADSGFGGERSRGWGRASEPQYSEAAHLFGNHGQEGLLWLLSLYSPHESDSTDWQRGEHQTVIRGGWTDSVAGSGAKKQVRMIAEGSVLASAALRGRAVDVAPEGFPHPVYRCGFALAMPAPAEIVVRTAEASRPPRPVAPAAPEIKSAPVPEVIPETPAISEPDSASAPDEFPSEEPLVTPGEDQPPPATASEELEKTEPIVSEPEVASTPDIVPEPFGAQEADLPNEAEPAHIPMEPPSDIALPPTEAETASDDFAPEDPLITPGDEAPSLPSPVDPAEAAEPPVVAPEPFTDEDAE